MTSSTLSCSSGSPSTSTATQATDLQDSDDSGVDLKPQIGHFLQRFSTLDHESSRGRRNKRKSSEPRKRKDVLLMKRFRWDDTDDEDNREDNDDVFDALEGERPSSGDSGFREAEETSTLTRLPSGSKKKTRPRQWRKPKTEAVVPEEEEDLPPSTPFRQSVICKNETSTTPPCTSTTTLLQHRGTPIASTVTSAKVNLDTKLYADPSGGPHTSDHDASDDPEGGQAGGSRGSCRPRNYKSMSRQRRIEANARERTRVHTISAAFESLRRAVPAYAHNQKLSKLAILRIASAYIVALACLNDGGAAEGGSPMSECVERCTRTLQAEGRSRRRTPSTKD